MNPDGGSGAIAMKRAVRVRSCLTPTTGPHSLGPAIPSQARSDILHRSNALRPSSVPHQRLQRSKIA